VEKFLWKRKINTFAGKFGEARLQAMPQIVINNGGTAI
jgi:hypothetical protein